MTVKIKRNRQKCRCEYCEDVDEIESAAVRIAAIGMEIPFHERVKKIEYVLKELIKVDRDDKQ